MKDSDIIEAVKAGNSLAYSHLVEKYQGLVFSIVKKVIKETGEAEEVAQDVFVVAFNKIENLETPAKFKAWLCRIALNTALNRYSRKKPVFIGLQYVDEHVNESVINEALLVMEAEARKRIIQQAVQFIHPEDRLLLEFYYLEELSIAEIAGITQLSSNSIKVKLHRIRKKLISIIGNLKN